MAQNLIAPLADFELIAQLANHRHLMQHPLAARKTQPRILKQQSGRTGLAGDHLDAFDRRADAATTVGTVHFAHGPILIIQALLATGKNTIFPHACILQHAKDWTDSS